jgi:hypothetical protein
MPRAPDKKESRNKSSAPRRWAWKWGFPIIVEPLFRTMIAQHVEFEFLEYARLG